MDELSESVIRQISETIAKLRQQTQLNVMSSWRYSDTDIPLSILGQPNFWETWPTVRLNEKGQIVWSKGKQVLWLVQKLVIPESLSGYPLTGLSLKLALTWWAEDVRVFVNQQLVQVGDLLEYFATIPISSAVSLGEEFTLALRLVSPGHDRGALMRSICIYEMPSDEGSFPLEPSFIADELAVLQLYWERTPEKLAMLAKNLANIDWSRLSDRQKFDAELATLRQNLQKIADFNSHIHLLGHAHLDMAWLWPVSETWIAAQRTFTSALNLQTEFPDLIFGHSTPALYAWLEEHRSDLFVAIQEQVKAGRWEVVGGMWIEPDLNLISGESIVRQILYGQRYFQAKFNCLSAVAWVPDTFGFCATLPQFLKLGGIEYFVTQKLAWNDTTKFPFGCFWWRSPDGTQVFSLMSALIGEDIDPIKMASYAIDWEIKTNIKDALWLPGIGDRGGGPTREMLETAKRWEKSPFFPKLAFSTTESYLTKISNQTSENIPVWEGELYLEFHRGCYTTHADQKRYNRRCEGLLYQAELWASLATLTCGTVYPKTELENSWKQVLFNQFHDILPGTSITQVFVEANQSWQEVERIAEAIIDRSLQAIASQISFVPPRPNAFPIVVFNSLNSMRSQVVSIPLPSRDLSWEVCDLAGTSLSTQRVLAENDSEQLIFVAQDVPSVGYRVFWLYPQESETLAATSVSLEKPLVWAHLSQYDTIISKNLRVVKKDSLAGKDWVLENEFLRVTVDPETGNLAGIFDKVNNREVLEKLPGNELQAFQDRGQYWDAWNIDPNYAEHQLPAPKLQLIEWIETGEIRQRLRTIRKLGESEFCQDYILEVRSPILKIVTSVNWQERQVMVKAAFPVNLTADTATYEIACGVIQRPTKPQTPQEKAKWEVPALRWACLNSQEYGVSLLNDCKYGYDSQPNRLRLTLLRSPSWPDPEADKGQHEFTYAVYPHKGDWRSANTIRRGYELNIPMQAMLLRSVSQTNSLPAEASLLDLGAENLILMALKQSEEDPKQWILRCYECHGETTQLNLQGQVGWEILERVDLLERSLPEESYLTNFPVTNHQPPIPNHLELPEETRQISPHQIASFRCVMAEGR